MALRSFRASKTFAVLMVCVAIFTDMFLANLVAPVLPFALSDIIGLEEKQVQIWNSTLIAIYGGALTFGSGQLVFCTTSCPRLSLKILSTYRSCWELQAAASSRPQSLSASLTLTRTPGSMS